MARAAALAFVAASPVARAFLSAADSSGDADGCVIPSVTSGKYHGKCLGIKYQYNVPKQCGKAGEPCGLIFDVHGWTMNGEAQNANTGMRELGDQHGYVVVQPTAPVVGLLTSWSSKDYPKVWSLVEAMRDEADLNIDKSRVHFMGFSQGSMMTWWMLQEHGDELASAVPMSCAAGDAEAVSKQAINTPVLYSHGYHDGLCNFNDGNRTVQILQQEWQLNSTEVMSQDDHHVRTAYRGPDGQYLETLFWDYESGSWGGLGAICGIIYKHVGDGHCFPGGADTQCFDLAHPKVSFPLRLAPFSCPAPDTSKAAFVIGEVAMQFFLDHPQRASGVDETPQLA